MTLTNELFAFECRLFQPIWMLQSGDIAIFQRKVIPSVPIFAECNSKRAALMGFIDFITGVQLNQRGNVQFFTLYVLYPL